MARRAFKMSLAPRAEPTKQTHCMEDSWGTSYDDFIRHTWRPAKHSVTAGSPRATPTTRPSSTADGRGGGWVGVWVGGLVCPHDTLTSSWCGQRSSAAFQSLFFPQPTHWTHTTPAIVPQRLPRPLRAFGSPRMCQHLASLHSRGFSKWSVYSGRALIPRHTFSAFWL